jgi:hypothetical protein
MPPRAIVVVAFIAVLLAVHGVVQFRRATLVAKKGAGYVVENVLAGCGWLFLSFLAVALFIPVTTGHPPNKGTMCLSNMRYVSQAIMLYAEDNDNYYPLPSNWCDALLPRVRALDIFQCPSLESEAYGFWMNARVAADKELHNDSDTSGSVLFFDSPGGKNQIGGIDDVRYRHGDKTNIALEDGSIRRRSRSEVAKLKW